ncbi:putative repeat protein (TIGR01451 family) [Paenibacillus phyllosphaerae]|uniref:Putative repeat protein (TIGR01451 family) n=1 Tax=Paenibacillus phyllosphaerae TaxID=274593 RepID=A0A7W5B316_9BACL|nr:DUF11 domain-containing protein [Paenibacillus phyllosphaerae]MBB3113512.1 putative repeat protein (TIGR01451 family) [Paenibacillus phyllosphaerae]
MTQGGARDFKLLNQTHVRFSSGSIESVAYSNTVQTPLVGAILQAAKQALPSRLSLGQTVTYSVIVNNSGNREAHATLYDSLPVGLSFIPNSVLVGGAPIPGASPDSGILLGTIGVGMTIALSFQAIVIAIPASLDFTNQARIEYAFSTYDGRIVNDAALSNVSSVSVAGDRLSVSGSLSSPVTFPGDVILYDVVLKNEGLDTLENVVIYIPLPPGFSFVPGSVVINGVLAAWIDPSQGIPIGVLTPGQIVNVRVSIRLEGVSPTPEVTIQGNVAYTINGTSYNEPVNPLKLYIVEPSLSVNLEVDQVQATIGSLLTYQVVVTNDSGFAVDASLTDLIPPGTSYVVDSMTINGAPRTGGLPAGGITLGTIRANSQVVVIYQVRIQPGAIAGGLQPVLNRVRVLYTYRLTDSRVVGQNAQSNTVKTELVAPIIPIIASAQPQYYEMGETVRFTMLVSNTGNLAADVILFRTAYPPGFRVLDPRIDGRSAPAFTLEDGLTLGLIAPGGTVRVTYMVMVAETDHLDLDSVTTRYTARYRYTYRDSRYSGESLSNELILPIDYTNE